AVHGVRGRVLEDEVARRHLDVRLDELEDAAAARDEPLGVDESALAVVVAAHRVEVVVLVVVERRLVAQPLVQRVRVVVFDRGVRVVRQVAHRSWSFTSSTMRCGESGRRVTTTPSGASASATAFTTAGGAPIAPPSPTPLNPPGPGLGVSMCPYSIAGTSAAPGTRESRNVVATGLPAASYARCWKSTPPIPWTTPPAIWPSTTSGLIIGPQSSLTM